jgi:hypothetical protein
MKQFIAAVASQFKHMAEGQLFRTDVSKDELWDLYLSSFPPGSNPVYKTRADHDCSSCKGFVRTVGGVVSITDDGVETIWDVSIGGCYQVVADALAAQVRGAAIENIFLHTERVAGVAVNRQLLEDKTTVKTWEHLFVNLPSAVVLKGTAIGPKLSEMRSGHDVFARSLQEITVEALDAVLELIAQNSLYRGEEHQASVEKFRKLKLKFDRCPTKDLFVWSQLQTAAPSTSRIRNTVIGTLLVDLSEGKDMEDAVKAFETKVAPTNYKRPTALITKAMIKKAQETVNELGFSSALERRFATIEDITINNVLFADRQARKNMNVFDELSAGTAENVKSFDKVEEIGIDDFIAKVLPKAESLEVLFENRHGGNLVSLIAPCDPTAKGLFKWPNNFSWSYVGDLADSIKERVKRAGGSVEGDLCCRLAWNYTDDLDFHMLEPGGFKIYYPNRRYKSPNGGELDLDANGADGIRTDPSENIFYTDRRTMQEGIYTLSVNNYSRRSGGTGFEIEIEFDGQILHMAYDKELRTGATVVVAKIQYSKSQGFKILESLPSTQSSKTNWGVKTQTFVRANVVMMSPNYWDSRAVGNRHYFFMLDGCLNDGTARGFYNEFLTDSLAQHRKVLEIVGSKMRTEEADRQLSGLGFSSTQRNNVLCRVKGAFTRTVKVTF